ncbi:hypothetical protein AKJ16_DCAP21833 [Drosera capensis]
MVSTDFNWETKPRTSHRTWKILLLECHYHQVQKIQANPNNRRHLSSLHCHPAATFPLRPLMGRKRGRLNPYSHFSTHPKRRRFPPSLTTEFPDPPPTTRPPPPPAIIVIGLPQDLSILNLKSRFEIYGPISRIRLDSHSLGFITFRTLAAAEAAVAAASETESGIMVDATRVQVVWDDGRGGGEGGGEGRRFSSKLVRAERPLSRLGRGNRLIPRGSGAGRGGGGSDVGGGFEGREIVAYDDIL